LRSMMAYRPSPSVTTDRLLSISTSLAASTVTPGSTAPEVSFTRPAIVLCADAPPGRNASRATTPRIRTATFALIGPHSVRHTEPPADERLCCRPYARPGLVSISIGGPASAGRLKASAGRVNSRHLTNVVHPEAW